VTDPFDAPGTASQVDWESLLGKLLLIRPLSKEEGVKTQDYGEKDAIRADMVVLDAEDGPDELLDILIFPLVLQGQLRRNIGKDRPVVGRLGQGEAKGKQKPPWKLLEASDADKEVARRYLTAQSTGKYDDVPF
jgi:hypothetical protein